MREIPSSSCSSPNTWGFLILFFPQGQLGEYWCLCFMLMCRNWEAGWALGRHNPAKALEWANTCLSVEVHKYPAGQAESYPADSSDPAVDWLGDFGNQVHSMWRIAVANETKNQIDTKPKINPANEKWMGTKLTCWPYKTQCMSPVSWLQQEQ